MPGVSGQPPLRSRNAAAGPLKAQPGSAVAPPSPGLPAPAGTGGEGGAFPKIAAVGPGGGSLPSGDALAARLVGGKNFAPRLPRRLRSALRPRARRCLVFRARPVEGKPSKRSSGLFIKSWEASGGGERRYGPRFSPFAPPAAAAGFHPSFFSSASLKLQEAFAVVLLTSSIVLQALPLGHNHMGFGFQVILFLF